MTSNRSPIIGLKIYELLNTSKYELNCDSIVFSNAYFLGLKKKFKSSYLLDYDNSVSSIC